MLKPSSDTCSCLVIVNWASKQQYVVVVSRHLIVGLRLQDKCQFLNHAKNKCLFLVLLQLGLDFQSSTSQPSHCHHNQSNLYLIFSKNPRVLN